MKTALASILLFIAPMLAAGEWQTRVAEAKAIEDPARKNEAILALIQEALAPHEVRFSGTSDAEHVSPQDNQPAPIINFDPRLQQKRSGRRSDGGATRSLQNNFGYYFSYRKKGYVVLGPAALDRRSPVLTRLSAEHELFHAVNHVGDPRSLADRELETWSEMFIAFFHQVHQFKQRWAPMLGYYEEATAGERTRAVERLIAYYESQPADPVRKAFDEWLERRKQSHASSLMVADLENAVDAVASVSSGRSRPARGERLDVSEHAPRIPGGEGSGEP
jgi:hypothetical protein